MFVTISLLLAVACLLPAAGKLTGQPRMRQSAAHFGIPIRVLDPEAARTLEPSLNPVFRHALNWEQKLAREPW